MDVFMKNDIDVPPRRIKEIVNGQHGIAADPALHLAAYFGTDAQIITLR